MICKKCGIDNMANSKYCYSCGTKLEQKAKAGVIVAIVLGIVLLVGIQAAAVTLVVNKVFFSNYTDEENKGTVSKKSGVDKLTDELYDEYDWLDD